MTKKLLLFCTIVVLSAHTVAAQELQTTQPPRPQDLSQNRVLGIGLQVPCAFSFRLWLTEGFGLEANAFFLSTPDFSGGCVAGKLLVRLADTNIFDFYTVTWVNFHLGEFAAPSLFDWALLGGMELSILPSLAINLEFGETLSFRPDRITIGPAISLGLHYYFLRAPREEPKPPGPEQP